MIRDLPGAKEHARAALLLAQRWGRRANEALASGDSHQGLEAARRALDEATGGHLPLAHEVVRTAYPFAIDAAVELGELDQVDSLITLLADRPQGEVPPFLRAQVRRVRVLVAIARHAD
ncbi:MAG: hypothetical protein ACYCST_11890 [Acidimicrobiales bacterium]